MWENMFKLQNIFQKQAYPYPITLDDLEVPVVSPEWCPEDRVGQKIPLFVNFFGT